MGPIAPLTSRLSSPDLVAANSSSPEFPTKPFDSSRVGVKEWCKNGSDNIIRDNGAGKTLLFVHENLSHPFHNRLGESFRRAPCQSQKQLRLDQLQLHQHEFSIFGDGVNPAVK